MSALVSASKPNQIDIDGMYIRSATAISEITNDPQSCGLVKRYLVKIVRLVRRERMLMNWQKMIPV